jgi:outer membrane lipoprotein carrier protein
MIRRPGAHSALLALFLLFLRPAQATPASDVDKLLDGVTSWTADFTQTIDDGHGKVLRRAAGKLYLQKPGKFRWD